MRVTKSVVPNTFAEDAPLQVGKKVNEMGYGSWLKSVAAVAGMILFTAVVGAAASLTVTVVDSGSGKPLNKAVVAVISGDAILAMGRTNSEGAWTGTVTKATARVTASKSLYASATTAPISTGANRQVRLELKKHQSADYKRFGRIVGFVRNAAGPVGNATLVLLKGTTPVGCAQPENATGVYELEWYP
ncbi:MAG: hypothetical protein ACOCZ7_02940, partial [Armatimonadota bacterium]